MKNAPTNGVNCLRLPVLGGLVVPVMRTLLCFLLSATVLYGHNGSVVVTSTVEGIVADGDLSDWPQDIAWHSVGLNLYGDPVSNEGDCGARFCVGIDPGTLCLYIGFLAEDDSYVEAPKGYVSWDTFDNPTFHIAPPSPQGQTGPSNQASINFTVASRYDDETKRLATECVADLRQAGFQDLDAAMAAAFTVGYNDKDEDSSFTVWFWSPEISKAVNPDRRGDLIICGPERGTLIGSVAKDDVAAQLGTLMLQFEEVDNPLLKFSLRTQAAGKYEIDLPPGRYRRSGENLITKTVEVRRGESTRDAITIQQSQPQVYSLSDFDSPGKTRPGYSQLLSKATADTPYYELTKLNGLPDTYIGTLAQDAFGALWIGTLSNLARYDGAQLQVYDQKLVNVVSGMWHDAENDRLWVAGKGIGYVAEGKFTKFLLPTSRAHCVGPTHEGKVSIGTVAGLYYWDEGKFVYHSEEHGLPDRIVKAVAADKKRRLTWFGTNRGLAAFDGENYQVYDQRHGLSDPRIISLFVDSRDVLWVGTASALFRYDGEFQLVRQHDAEKASYARSFTELEDGTVIVAAFDGTIRIPVGYPDEPIKLEPSTEPSNCVLLDRDLQLWQGFENGGLRRIDLGLQHICRLDGRCDFLYSIGEYLWFLQKGLKGLDASATVDANGTVVRYHKGTGDIVRYPIHLNDGNETPKITNFLATDGGVWAGTESHGVYELGGENWQRLELPDESFSQIMSLCLDSNDRLWIAATKRLYVREDDRVVAYRVPVRPNADFLHVTETPDGHVVVGTSVGLFIMNNEELVSRYDESNGLISNSSSVLSCDSEGRLWVATNLGLQGISGSDSIFYNTDHGLLDNRPTRFLTFWGDEIWCGSDAGVNRISTSQKMVQHLLDNDGLGRYGIYAVAPDGDAMWLAGDSGLWRYRAGKHPPRIAIENVTTDTSLGPLETMAVTTDLESVRVDFHANSLKNRPAGMLYHYRLKGVSDDWTATSATHVTIPVPDSGSYAFEVKATDRDLLTSDIEVMNIDVSPPFARLATQLGLVAVSIACVILGCLYFARVRRERSILEQRVRERTAQLSSVERQLQQSQKMEALGTLATGVAHDFNNSLLAISGNAELGILSDSLQEKNELLSEVIAVTEQAAALTQSMLMFGGKASSEKQNVDIRDAVWNAEKILRRTLPASIDFACVVPAEPVYCKADVHQLEQVVLNLSLNAIVKDHEGAIQVDSSEGNGTQFCVTLPTTTSGETSRRQALTSLPQSRGRVLLADDEPQVRQVLVQALKHAGFEVDDVPDGASFVEKFSQVSEFDLVIVDVDMPNLNGWQCLEEVRKQSDELKAIVISGLPNQQRRDDGHTTFIRKPFSLRDLVEHASRIAAKDV